MKTELKKFLTVKNITILSVTVAVLIVGLILLWEPAVQLFNERHVIEEFIMSFGMWAPLFFIILQIAQVVLAPIPGNAVSFVGGYLFGWWGLLMTVVGSTIGFVLVVLLSRKFGRPLVEKIFKKDQIAKFDYIIKKNGTVALFLIFLFPFFPDDLLSYLAGLTKIKMRKLIVICIAGRFPGYLLLNLVGSGVNSGDVDLIVGITSVVLVIGMLLFWKKDWLNRFIKADSQIEFLKQSFAKLKRK